MKNLQLIIALLIGFSQPLQAIGSQGADNSGGGTGVVCPKNSAHVLFDLFNKQPTCKEPQDNEALEPNQMFSVVETKAYQRLLKRFDIWSTQSDLIEHY